MNRREFMERLKALLSDIPERDREEALEYYESYFDDAGPENENRVIRDLGSPEKVAAEIKAGFDTDGNQGEYTDTGYKDSRFETRNDIRKRETQQTNEKKKQRNLLLYLLIGILTFPFWGALLGAAFALLAGIGGLLLGLIVGSFAGALGFLAGGVALVAAGIAQCATAMGLGVTVVGGGLISLSFGIVCGVAFVWFTFKAIPALVRFLIDGISGLLHR